MSQDTAAPLPPRSRTILVVDDEPALLRLMAFLLQRKGYGMLTATNGEEALHVIREQRPDLVLLDIMMPRLDGYEVAEAIRADPATAEIPIVMLSAKAQDEDIERGLAAGVDSYITKPFDPEKLAETVAAFLSGDPASPPEPAKRGS
jgi:two-component system alkaline phosphatase synthesis response regulator PhoP